MGVSAAQAKAKIITPAIQGTENVLASVNKVSSITRVVLTSSCAAVYGK
jgi:dihydroflavonol-4-reductase